ncbi:MAG TPA: S41 family peptidase [Vicinamibacterales bacterium]
MTSRTRAFVLAVSIPVIAYVVIGGYLGQALAKDDTYQHLRVFEDVVSLVLNNYVEEVDVTVAMKGAMKGLADGLDPESAYLTPELAKTVQAADASDVADVGLAVTRQYYLRIVAAKDGSPGARAGLRSGDFIRAIDNRPTRDMSAYEGARLLRGAPGSKVSLLVIRGNAAEPHVVDLVRERLNGSDLTSRMADASTGYIRIVEFSKESPARLKQAIDALARTKAVRHVIDLRGTARGDLDDGIAAARLFVKSGTLAIRQAKGDQREVITAQPGDGTIVSPVVLLINQGTAGPGEVFAAALDDNDRADLVGEQTIGRAARQRLITLPDGSGLLLSYLRYLTPDGNAIHEKGLMPDEEVEQPEVEFGAEPPAADTTLQKALERISKS